MAAPSSIGTGVDAPASLHDPQRVPQAYFVICCRSHVVGIAASNATASFAVAPLTTVDKVMDGVVVELSVLEGELPSLAAA